MRDECAFSDCGGDMAPRTGTFLFFLILSCGTFAIPQTKPTTSHEDNISEIEDGETTMATVTTTDGSLAGSIYSFHSEPVSWLEAVVQCWQDGSELAFARSPQEAQVLAQLLFQRAASIHNDATQRDAVHVGVHAFIPPHWRTIDGRLLSAAGYDLWLEGGNGKCGALFADGRYYQQDCKTKLAYFCQRTSLNNPLAVQNYTLIPGVGRFRLHETPLPWAQAQQRCLQEGGALAVPSSARAAGLLAGALIWRRPPAQRAAGCFIGATDIASEGTYTTSDGTTLELAGYNSWQANEPSGNRSENCAVLKEDGLYADYHCLSPHPYICEFREAISDSAHPVFHSLQYHLHVEQLTWWEALVACRARNMTLAVPRTGSDVDELRSLIRKVGETAMFIGIHRMNSDNVWIPVNGETISSFSNDGNEDNYNARNYHGNLRFYPYSGQSSGECVAMSREYYYKANCFEKQYFACE